MTTPAPRNIIIIPARLASTRLPRKLLAEAGGKSVLRHTWERCLECESVDFVMVASGDDEIVDHCKAKDMLCVRTKSDHPNGTSRVAEAASNPFLYIQDRDRIVIVQGDEPEIDPATIDMLFEMLEGMPAGSAATLAVPFSSEEEWRNPNRVKVAFNSVWMDIPKPGTAHWALYFSRAPIGSWTTTRRHLGVYAYDGRALRDYAEQPAGGLESAENLEQLRHLQAGGLMEVVMVDHAHVGIDTAEDLEAFRQRVADREGRWGDVN